jgi:signal transduction histidine kinase
LRSAVVAGLLVAAIVAAALVAAIGFVDDAVLAAAGLVGASAFAGAFAIYLIVAERRRHESAEDALHGQTRFLESLVESIAVISDSRDPRVILERTCAEARNLFGAASARIIPAREGPVRRPHATDDALRVPLRAGGEPIGTLELRRETPFPPADLMRATVLADFASRAVENARLLVEAHEREEERARLTERLITAEQDERRRLSIFLHDGPLQTMSGIALMHDAALAAIEEGRHEDAAKLVASSLERERDTIRTLRDLSFAIEPLVLRDQGFVAAVEALAEQVEGAHRITVSTDVEPGERLGEKAQVALYQLIREAVNQAVRRRPNRIAVTVGQNGDGFTTQIDDDGMGERRRGGFEELDERARVLNGRVAVDTSDAGGTTVRVVLPAYAAAPAE